MSKIKYPQILVCCKYINNHNNKVYEKIEDMAIGNSHSKDFLKLIDVKGHQEAVNEIEKDLQSTIISCRNKKILNESFVENHIIDIAKKKSLSKQETKLLLKKTNLMILLKIYDL